MARCFLIAAVLTVPSLLLAQSSATAPATMPAADAYPVYQKAASRIRQQFKQIESPSNSNLIYPEFPPFGEDWLKLEKRDFDADADIRNWVHQAAGMDRAGWPRFEPGPDMAKVADSIHYLSECRSIVNEMRDAALYQGLCLKDEPAAFQSLEDTHHMAVLLQNQPGIIVVRELVADGIIDANVLSSNIIVSGVTITNDPANHHDLPLVTARKWIGQLLDHPDAQARSDVVIDGDFRFAQGNPPRFKTKKEFLESPDNRQMPAAVLKYIRRTDAERDMAAMSLAAHVYQFKHGRWPASLNELATELPKTPIDPFGDDNETLGYALIPHGLPDGGDRPLVYSRCESRDGLAYRVDAPQYGFYIGDGTGAAIGMQKHGGEFRDVARWVPVKTNPNPNRTTRPLNGIGN